MYTVIYLVHLDYLALSRRCIIIYFLTAGFLYTGLLMVSPSNVRLGSCWHHINSTCRVTSLSAYPRCIWVCGNKGKYSDTIDFLNILLT